MTPRIRTLPVLALIAASLPFMLPLKAHAAPIALVFGGDGTENDLDKGTLKSAIRAAQAAGFETVTVVERVPEELLGRASLWIQPGGPNFEQAEHMQRTGVWEQVKSFVSSGGGYVGFCGGAYMAQSHGPLGLGLVPGNAVMQDEETVAKIPVIWEGHRRYIHYEHGPRFQKAKGFEVFANYESNGAPAAIRGKYGQGRVLLTGPHPEAWENAWEPFEDPDGPDLDLAIEVLKWASRPERSSGVQKPYSLSSFFSLD